MKKFLCGAILVNGFKLYDSTKFFIERMKEEFLKRNVKDIDVIYSDQIKVFVENNSSVLDLKKYDFILFLDKDKYVSKLLEHHGYRLFNSSKAIELCDDKMLTYISLLNSNVNMPKTISSVLCYEQNPDTKNLLDNVTKELKFPLIVKENFGSLGKQVYLANNKNELENLEKELIYKPHLFQEFISDSSGKDIRVIVVGNEVIGAMERYNPNSFKSNIGDGGSGKNIAISEEMKRSAIEAARTLGLDYCGIDFVIDRYGKHYLIEVNSNAFFHEFEKVTGKNVAEKYVKHILKEMKYE